MTNVVRDANVVIDQIELYIAPLEPGTEISVETPSLISDDAPFVSAIAIYEVER